MKVRIERREVVHVPGSYNLYTPELVKGLEIYHGACFPEMEPEVCVRPEGRELTLKHSGNHWSSENLLLPGQEVEIKFALKSSFGIQASVGGWCRSESRCLVCLRVCVSLQDSIELGHLLWLPDAAGCELRGEQPPRGYPPISWQSAEVPGQVRHGRPVASWFRAGCVRLQ